MKPDDLLKALLSRSLRPEKRKSLTALHEVCRYQAEAGLGDRSAFSIAEIGRICEARGLFKARTLYNKQAEDYRSLIEAWASYAATEKNGRKEVKKSDDIERLLLKIDDFAVRGRVQMLISENKRLLNQLNICKQHSGLVIDQRPPPISTTTSATSFTVVEIGSGLTPAEHRALSAAISAEFMNENEFRIGTSGEVYFRTGRLLYEPGYVSAIKKIIAQ